MGINNHINKNGGKIMNSKKTLVAYFSCSGVTAKTAQTLAKAAGADIFEIKPAIPYTSADLNWSDKNSRSSVEMNDQSIRPAIAEKLSNMADYDIVFVGFPIWWYIAPTIINTFLESYDFSGKTIIPFCTSGSSGIGSSAKNLHSTVSDNAVWLDGDRLNGNSSKEDISKWISGLDLDVKAQ